VVSCAERILRSSCRTAVSARERRFGGAHFVE
jgi:hypothetical protein